jgi:hypothetical protein
MLQNLTAAHLYTIHKGQSGSRGLSPRLWSKVNGQALSPDGGSNAYSIGDDYLSIQGAVSSNVGKYYSSAGAYTTYEDTSCSVAQLNSEVGGVLRLLTDATDNNEVWLENGSTTSVLGTIASAAASRKLTIFEARVRPSKITAINWFCGLSEANAAVADTITDAGALASKDFVGFWCLEDAPSTLKFGFRKNGQSLVTLASYGTALAASTWYKIGLVYDPLAPSSKRISYFVDNIEQSTYATATQVSGSTFPDASKHNFLAGVKNGSAAVSSLDLDYWNYFQAG